MATMRADGTDCRECFLRGCDCTCNTCITARTRNNRLTNLELTRLSIAAGLAESDATEGEKKRVTRMLRGQGL